MLLTLFFAAALGLNPNNKIITPGLGSRAVVRTQAYLVNSEPGEYLVDAYKNAEGNVPGEKIEGVRVNPPKLFLRDSRARRVLLSIPTSSLNPGPLWICIAENDTRKNSRPSSGSQLTVLTRSCYQRILRARKSSFLR